MTANVEASVHQVRIEISADRVPGDPAERAAIEGRIVERAEHWAKVCVAERHVEIADVLPLTYFTKLMRDVMVRHQHLWTETGSLAIVLVWGVIGLVAALRSFRWQPREG